MFSQFSRSELVMGKAAVLALRAKRVAVFGVGGVGSFAIEALARAGIGYFLLVDNDVVSITNINRQLVALHSTIGLSKVDVMKERILDINPEAIVDVKKEFYLPETADSILSGELDYIVDAIDTVTGKISLVEEAKKRSIPVISVMGAGNKMDPSRFEVTDISKTSYCPLAKVMRRELRDRGIRSLKVVYSKEEPIKPKVDESASGAERRGTTQNGVPGSVSFVPPVAGMIAASEVIKDLIQLNELQTEEISIAISL